MLALIEALKKTPNLVLDSPFKRVVKWVAGSVDDETGKFTPRSTKLPDSYEVIKINPIKTAARIKYDTLVRNIHVFVCDEIVFYLNNSNPIGESETRLRGSELRIFYDLARVHSVDVDSFKGYRFRKGSYLWVMDAPEEALKLLPFKIEAFEMNALVLKEMFDVEPLSIAS